MKRLKYATTFSAGLACFLIVIITASPATATGVEEALARCAAMTDNAARLKCYDELSGREFTPKETSGILPDQQTGVLDIQTPSKDAAGQPKALSVMERHWDMNREAKKERNTFVLWPYRPCYFLPIAYNSSPNKDADLDFDPKAKALHNEVKFQISFKFKLWRDIIRSAAIQNMITKTTGIRGVDLWVAYTQQSFWQLYNSDYSAPFRETNYEPELLLNFRFQQDIPYLMGTKLQFINVGFNHQSNGRSEPLSRSWNRIVASVGLEKSFGPENQETFGLLLKTWVRVPEKDETDDNPDLTDYTGYGELWGTLYWKKQRFAVMLRNNLRSDNVGAVQLEWSMPLATIHQKLARNISLYVQYFNGYGESLLDYNKSTNRISVGLMLADWL
ncbi:MAG TPA: phospholipase A [Smithella sp.]|nr:phospholipase A [Smithella sp.]